MYSKPPFAGPKQVLAYLGRYAYRIALSNDRLVGLQNGQVTFRWKDRAHGNVPRLATLDAEAFLGSPAHDGRFDGAVAPPTARLSTSAKHRLALTGPPFFLSRESCPIPL